MVKMMSVLPTRMGFLKHPKLEEKLGGIAANFALYFCMHLHL